MAMNPLGNIQRAVVALSGGMDSATTLAIAISLDFEPCALHITYGQRTKNRELKAFNQICDYYKISTRLVIPIDYLTKIGGSALTDSKIEIPPANLNMEEIPNTYVPFRNGNILSIAASWAEVLDANAIFIGAVERDSSGYPDCRETFFTAMENAINFGTKPTTNIKIYTPLIKLSKKEIVLKGAELGVPFHLTWSCYKNEDIACGECDSCALRLRGFQQAGIEDPIPYKNIIKYF